MWLFENNIHEGVPFLSMNASDASKKNYRIP